MKKLVIGLLVLGFCLTIAGSVFAQATYVGSQICGVCHPTYYSNWQNSGHRYKFQRVQNGVQPTYPNYVENYQDQWMSGLGSEWTQISGVIGGYGWKARFVDQTGIIAGTASSAINPGVGHNQINFFDGMEPVWSNYEMTTTNKKFNYSCFKCHVTGPTTTGTWLAADPSLGNFAEQGISCEACHGPGSLHMASPSGSPIDEVYEFDINGGNGLGGEAADPDGDDVLFLCGTCHNRNFNHTIEAKSGFIEHHEQWEEVSTWDDIGPTHGSMTCVTCHNPHKGVLWNGDGIIMACQTCHGSKHTNHTSEGVTCIDCHMAFAVKSGAARGQSGFKGDVHSHLFKITPNAVSMFSEDGLSVRNDATRRASLDLRFACLGCHNDSPTDNIPDKTVDDLVAYADNMHRNDLSGYVGSDMCRACHNKHNANVDYNIYDEHMKTGHPYKLNAIVDGQPPVFPANTSPGVPSTPPNTNWSDFSYMIGGYGWKARFVRNDGYVYTAGPDAQYNIHYLDYNQTDPWVPYNQDQTVAYNYACFSCHTTGASSTGEWRPGVAGTFNEPGVRCEGCHGAAGAHVMNPTVTHPPNSGDALTITRCGDCHQRGGTTNAIPASGGWIQHHEQINEMRASKHGNGSGLDLTCGTCHDPHIANVYPEAAGEGLSAIKMGCETCHPNRSITVTYSNGTQFTKPTQCVDCHMPEAGKSALGIAVGNGWRGDIPTHIWGINTTAVPRDSMFVTVGSSTRVRLDNNGLAAVTLDFVCLNCHQTQTLDWAAEYADGIHDGITVGIEDDAAEIPQVTALQPNFPNPFNKTTNIRFDLSEAGNVEMIVYNASGQKVKTLVNRTYQAGIHTVNWDGTNEGGQRVSAGAYFYQLNVDGIVGKQKMMLIE